MRLSDRLSCQPGEDVVVSKIHRCFEGLDDASGLLLAVSGGPDSMALMHLVVDWAGRLAAPPVLHVATVDHGLRSGARQEAELVAAAASALKLPHTILSWAGPKPASGIQEKARAARYALLADHARAVGASHILTAHHADDQAETVLLRLGRGSGLAGLAGMRRLAPLTPDLWLVRPLLGLAKAQLVTVCQAESIPFVEDPSNHDPAFARAKLRREAGRLAALGLDTPGLVRLAHRMARADQALEAEAERVEGAVAPARTVGRYEACLEAARDVAPEIAMRLLSRAIAHVAGEAPLRLERLEALAERIWEALRAGATHHATLGGTQVVLDRAGTLTVVLEPLRRRGVGRGQIAST